MKLTRYEMETIINFNEAETEANIYTHNPTLTRRLEKLAAERPSECKAAYNQGSHGVSYDVPKKWVKINPPRTLTDEHRAKLAEQLKNAR